MAAVSSGLRAKPVVSDSGLCRVPPKFPGHLAHDNFRLDPRKTFENGPAGTETSDPRNLSRFLEYGLVISGRFSVTT